MAVIFVNYRTDDAPGSAALVERELSQRFGSGQVFRASKSIRPGDDFAQTILRALRKCSVLLAIIGPRWLAARNSHGVPALHDETDWVRREIAEAFACGIRVVPILLDKTPRLNKDDLPADLAALADCQYLNVHHRNLDYDLTRLCVELAALVPELTDSGPRGPAGNGKAGSRDDAGSGPRATVERSIVAGDFFVGGTKYQYGEGDHDGR